MAPPTLRPLSLGEVLDTAFALYRDRFVPLLVIAVVCRSLPLMLEVYFELTPDTPLLVLLQLLNLILALVLVSVAVAASTFVVSDSYLGRETTAGEALSRSLPHVVTLLGISILTSLVVGVGLLLLLVPGIIFLAGFLLSPVVAVIENPARSADAMTRSWRLSKGFKGKVLLTMLVASLLLVVPIVALAGVGGMLGLSTDEGLFGVLFLVIPLVLQVFVYPFVYVVQTVLYYDLRVRKEGFDLEVLADAMQQA